MKQILLLLLLSISFLSFKNDHKFYVSVTDVNYSEEDRSIQVLSRYFIDDMERTLKERYGINPRLMSENELNNADFYIEKYLRSKFGIFINGKEAQWEFLGKEYDIDVMKVYLEIKNVKATNLKSVSVYSLVLCDMFEEQQNIIHMNIGGKKKSFMLHLENDKAMLNF